MTISPRPFIYATLLAVWTSACAQRSSTARTETDAPTQHAPAAGSTVKGNDLERNPNESPEKILEGRIAGVRVSTAPDGSLVVRIREGSSMYGSNQPLFVIDGIPVEPGPGGSLSGINPRDIESIKVLKDVASTSMYGVRGSNGVIVIKTKKP